MRQTFFRRCATKISHLKKESKNIILFLVLKGTPRVFSFLLCAFPRSDERMERRKKSESSREN